MVEMARDPLVQSGGIYSLIPVKPNTNNISADVILISNWARYRNYQCSATRTLLIDATEDQKKAYKTLLGCFQYCTSQLTAGKRIKDIYNEGVKYVQDNSPELIPHLTKSFGCGTGCLEGEKLLNINGENENTIVPGSAFELRIGLEGMSDKKMKYSMILADTLLIGAEGKTREILTGAISKAFKDISYSMSEEPDDKEEKQAEEKSKIDPNIVKEGNKVLSQVLNSERQLRDKNRPKDVEGEAARRVNQKKLLEEKMIELKQRFSSKKFGTSEKISELRKLTDVLSYDSPMQFPPDAKFGSIYIDKKKESLLVPIGKRIIPFHVSTIKNVSKTDESGGHSFLRVNFHVPGDGAAFNTPLGFPKPDGINFAYLKEITIKMNDQKVITNAHKMIKEIIKQLKIRDQEKKEKDGLIVQKTLIQIKGKRPSLGNISVRPNITGKKTTGILEGHSNGLRFTSGKSEKVDVIYENIKHAFYQPCENELIVLLHFNLKNSIMIGNKKTKDVQFYTEIGLISDDVDSKRRNFQDIDELEQENRERLLRKKLNSEFKRFSDQIQQLSKIEFDIPYRELAFHGVPQKANVLLSPTLNCLVNLTEVPFFVITLSELEVVHFERVNFSLRNFDMVLINKDLTNYTRISCIPSENLEGIKDWLNELNLIYSEGAVNLNWTNVLTEIRENPEGFLEQNGWGFLQENSESANSEEDEKRNEDSEFSLEPENDESEYSSEEDNSEEYSEVDESDEEDAGNYYKNYRG